MADEVGPFERVAAGEYHDRSRGAKPRQIVEDGAHLRAGELVGVPCLDCLGAAVSAQEVTSTGQLEQHQERPSREIERGTRSPTAAVPGPFTADGLYVGQAR